MGGSLAISKNMGYRAVDRLTIDPYTHDTESAFQQKLFD